MLRNCGFQAQSKKVVGLARVSTAQQCQSGLGLAAQKDSIIRFCEREGLELLEIIEEVESGCSDDRPALDRLLKVARKNKAFACVARIDRLSRKVSVISQIMEDGQVPIISCELGMNVQPFMIHVWSAFAAAEREKISLRTKVALQAKMATGWKAGQNINEINELGRQRNRAKADEFALSLKSVVGGLQANGCNTYNGLALELTKAGIKTARGGDWSAQTVKRLVKRLEALEVLEDDGQKK